MSSFFDYNNPEAEAHMSYAHAALIDKTELVQMRNCCGLLPQGYCKRKTLKC